MRYQVKLRLFQDDATGDWGVTHDDTCNDNRGLSFNAFWNGIGIFHDVFEHTHEHKHKYFKGSFAMNIIGEIAATGHVLYFHTINRPVYGTMLSIEETAIADTWNLIEEAVRNGYTSFGDELLCMVPRQLYSDPYTLSCFVSEYDYKLHDLLKRPIEADKDSREYETAIQFRKSVKLWKIRNAVHWGYKRAERLFPRTGNNCDMIGKFFEYWDRWCRNNEADQLAQSFDQLIFTIHTGENAKWKAQFRSNYDRTLIDHREI